ncbi:MAG: hypothetical protein ACTSRG_21885 [Candidatus Helarchaeota archaeon]
MNKCSDCGYEKNAKFDKCYYCFKNIDWKKCSHCSDRFPTKNKPWAKKCYKCWKIDKDLIEESTLGYFNCEECNNEFPIKEGKEWVTKCYSCWSSGNW